MRPSRLLSALLVLLHLAAVAAVLLAVLPWWIKLLCGLVLCLLAWRAWHLGRLHLSGSVVAFRERGSDWWLELADGRGMAVQLLPDVLVWRYVLVLRFRPVGARPSLLGWMTGFTAVVLPDSLPPQGFRRLYVRLRFRHWPEDGEA